MDGVKEFIEHKGLCNAGGKDDGQELDGWTDGVKEMIEHKGLCNAEGKEDGQELDGWTE